MSEVLLKAGFSLLVHSRSQAPVEALVAQGATAAASPRQVAEESDIVLTCLPDLPAVRQVYLGPEGVLQALRPDHLLADHSTVDPDTSRELYAAADAAGAAFLDAPMSGGPARAVDGSLTFMVGGDAEPFEKARPIFDALGANIYHVGPAGAGTVIKLANQLLVGIHTAASVEALILVAKAGADPRVAVEVIGSSFGASAMLNRNGPLVLARRFDAVTPVDLILKDLRLITKLAEDQSIRLLLGNMAKQLFGEASILGLGGNDMAALVQPLERLAGVEVGGGSEGG
jgi:3-hydroxyisobutyrate dehydrogenase/2-hydroxy-3-oxopropionate reductase